jgi:hypothetical protein
MADKLSTADQFKNGDRVRLTAQATAKPGYNHTRRWYTKPDRIGTIQSLRPRPRRETVDVLWDGRTSPERVIEADLELAPAEPRIAPAAADLSRTEIKAIRDVPSYNRPSKRHLEIICDMAIKYLDLLSALDGETRLTHLIQRMAGIRWRM